MQKMFLLMRREFAHLALTPALYVVLAALTTLYSYVFYAEARATEKALLEPTVFLIGVLALFWVPMLTMRSFAGENANGTLELLFTSPVRPVAVVLGKFFGCVFFYLLSLLPYAGYVAILTWHAEIDSGAFLAMALGLFAIGAAQIAVGLWISALTSNIIVAAAGASVVNFLGLMLSLPIERGATVFSFPAHLSWWAHFKEIFCRGLIDTRTLVFFVSYTALFLFLTWLAVTDRSSAGGEKSRRRPLLIAAISALIAVNVFLFGGIARLGGETIYSALAAGDFFGVGLPVTISGGWLIIALIALKFSRRKNWRREQIPHYLATVAAILIFANINYLATTRLPQTRSYYRWDLTANQTNTLAPATRAALDQLQETLTVTIFLSEHISYENLPLVRYLRDLLSEFTAYSPKVKTAFYDAVSDAETANAAAKKLNLPAANLTQTIVVDYGERRQIIPLAALLEEPDSRQRLAGIKTPNFRGELALAIVARRLSDYRATTVYFAANIGEMQPFGDEPVLNNAGLFADSLLREAYQLRPWEFKPNEIVPLDCDVLIIAGFNQPLDVERTAMIGEFLERGGRLLLMLPSPQVETAIGAGRNYQTGMEFELAKIGIRANGDLIIDEKNNFAGQRGQILTLLDESSPIQTGAPQTVIVIPQAQSLRVADEEPNPQGWILYRVARSLKPSQRVISDGKNNSDSPVASGAATVIAAAARPATGTIPEARLVVIGASGLASNLFITKEGNQNFLSAGVRWLAGRHYNIAVEPRNYLTYSLNLTPTRWRVLWWLTLIAMPEAWLLIGAIVWWRRRE